MRTYTATVQWLAISRRGRYSLRSATVRGIRAASITEASGIALSRCTDKIDAVFAEFNQRADAYWRTRKEN